MVALQNIVEDPTPQLGGDLDVQANQITTSTTNSDIVLSPDGTGEVNVTGNISMTGSQTVDGRDVSVDGTKLDGVEANATADQSAAEIKTAYEANADTNEFSDLEQTKLAGIETDATADQSNAEIKTAYEANANTNEFSDLEQTKLAGVEANATADQSASEILTDLLTVDGTGSSLDADLLDGNEATAFATSAQGTTADSAMQDLVDDTTPQLGGNLDVQARSITTSTTNGDITLTPNGTGAVELGGQAVLPSYTVANLPTGSTGGMTYVTDEIDGAIPAFFDGTNWRRVSDRTIVSVTPPFAATGAEFDGTNDWTHKSSDLTSIADGKVGSISAWLKFDTSDTCVCFASQGPSFYFQQLGGGTVHIFGKNTSSTTILDIGTSSLSLDTWHHLLFSWDLTDTAKRHIYVDDSSDFNLGTYTNDTIDYTRTSWDVGSFNNGSSLHNGCMAELWFDPTSYIDFSITANRRKFIDAAGKPVDLGSDGSTPTGSQPILYLNGDETDFEINQGSGGDFTVTGTLTACSDSPSD